MRERHQYTAHGPVRVVLVVEDDPAVAELLAGAINDEPGYVAVRVGKGTDALRALETVNADLVLMDIGLPGLSGLEVLDRMREDERLRKVPVVFETAAVAAHAKDMRARGIAAYVKKPFDLNDIVAFVKKLAPVPRAANYA
ncbi:MAG TPA: response regulator [Candidatus Limnocylindria bacterium]|nr:response regulator [Candidatus Limnocylindria bacterium]